MNEDEMNTSANLATQISPFFSGATNLFYSEPVKEARVFSSFANDADEGSWRYNWLQSIISVTINFLIYEVYWC